MASKGAQHDGLLSLSPDSDAAPPPVQPVHVPQDDGGRRSSSPTSSAPAAPPPAHSSPGSPVSPISPASLASHSPGSPPLSAPRSPVSSAGAPRGSSPPAPAPASAPDPAPAPAPAPPPSSSSPAPPPDPSSSSPSPTPRSPPIDLTPVGSARSSASSEEMSVSATRGSAPILSSTALDRHVYVSAGPGSPQLPQAIDPATIPVRTSSTRATVATPLATRRSRQMDNLHTPRKHKSMSGFVSLENGLGRTHRPEVDEKVWLGQSRDKRRFLNNTQQHFGFPMPPTSSSPPPTLSSFPSPYSPVKDSRPATTMGISAIGQLPENYTSRAPAVSPPRTVGGTDLLINGDGEVWTAEKENILKGPFEYLELHPGKDIRGQLITAFNSWLQVPSPSLAIITRVVGMLHTASLLIDDVEDSSQLRRGVPVAHSIFGTAQTINSANYIYFCALQELLKLNNAECVQIYTEELLNLHRGQGMDLFWRDTLTCPSEDDYLEMVGNKTGGLFRLAIKLMCAESTSHNFISGPGPIEPPSARTLPRRKHPSDKTDYVPLVNTIGLLFQILDDYLNLNSSKYTENKGLCEDLTEGKFSFPVIHAIRADTTNLVLINILKQKTRDDEVKRYAVSYMEQKGSFAYTRRVLRGLTRKALQLVDEVDRGRGQSAGIVAILEKLKLDSPGAQRKASVT